MRRKMLTNKTAQKLPKTVLYTCICVYIYVCLYSKIETKNYSSEKNKFRMEMNKRLI